nr:hypothetical protein [Oceanococcus sp. HetDA_MAG_MS8]
MTGESRTLNLALRRILRPLARFCLAQGVSAPQFYDLVKQEFVAAALEKKGRDGKRQTKSAIALATGLTRVEVSKQWGSHSENDAPAQTRVNYGQRLVAAWVREPAFTEAPGKPRPLAFDADECSFAELVRRFGANMPPRAALDELLERGVVSDDGQYIRLLRRSYIPEGLSPEKVTLLGIDGAAMLGTLEHNLRPGVRPRFERKVSFRHLNAAGVALLKQRAEEQGQPLLEALDAELAKFAADEASEDTAHAGLGIYIYEEPDHPSSES